MGSTKDGFLYSVRLLLNHLIINTLSSKRASVNTRYMNKRVYGGAQYLVYERKYESD